MVRRLKGAQLQVCGEERLGGGGESIGEPEAFFSAAFGPRR